MGICKNNKIISVDLEYLAQILESSSNVKDLIALGFQNGDTLKAIWRTSPRNYKVSFRHDFYIIWNDGFSLEKGILTDILEIPSRGDFLPTLTNGQIGLVVDVVVLFWIFAPIFTE